MKLGYENVLGNWTEKVVISVTNLPYGEKLVTLKGGKVVKIWGDALYCLGHKKRLIGRDPSLLPDLYLDTFYL